MEIKTILISDFGLKTWNSFLLLLDWLKAFSCKCLKLVVSLAFMLQKGHFQGFMKVLKLFIKVQNPHFMLPNIFWWISDMLLLTFRNLQSFDIWHSEPWLSHLLSTFSYNCGGRKRNIKKKLNFTFFASNVLFGKLHHMLTILAKKKSWVEDPEILWISQVSLEKFLILGQWS